MEKELKSSPPTMYADPEDLRVGEMVSDTQHDAVFGEMTEGGPNYRNVNVFSLDFVVLTL